MYVYCDLVEPHIVGDAYDLLLQIVSVEGSNDQIINGHYPRLFTYQLFVNKKKRENDRDYKK